MFYWRQTFMYSLSATSIACFGPMCNLDEATLSNSMVWRAGGGALTFDLAVSAVTLPFLLSLRSPKRTWATSWSKTPARRHSGLIITPFSFSYSILESDGYHKYCMYAHRMLKHRSDLWWVWYTLTSIFQYFSALNCCISSWRWTQKPRVGVWQGP